jgi:23S rRNA (uracil-5-)-methyltransferase RumA
MPSSAPFRAAGALEKKEENDPKDGQPEGSSWFDKIWEGIEPGPLPLEYRNKMEFSFGDSCKDGELTLGLHKAGSFYDILQITDCKITNDDYNIIVRFTIELCREWGLTYCHKMSHEGYLRHLLIRRAATTGEILVNIVTTSQWASKTKEILDDEEHFLKEYTDGLLALNLNGNIVGILHSINDDPADAVKADKTLILHGKDFFFEEILGQIFKITTFSFFQTNSFGAEVLYKIVRDFVGDTKDMDVFDLYSGTGTIAQILAPVAKSVTGVEIVPEAVESAKMNAALNLLSNCDFICGDVLKVLDDLKTKPDLIVLDPPREGIHPKALTKIINYGVDTIVYVSCKPTSLARDLEMFNANGYRVVKAKCCDMFPWTVHVETVVQLKRS